MADTKNAPTEAVRHWLAEIGAAQKREDDFRKDGKRLRSIYKGEKDKQTPFNILFSNTETILPALYSATPRPVVQRRYKDDDPTGKAASDAGQRILEFLVDTNIEGYESFDDCVTAATMDSLIPGRGVSSVKYDAEIADDYVNGELACVSSESWDRVYYGYAKKWSRVPWIAYEMYVDKEEAEKLFTAPIAAKIQYTAGEGEDDKTLDEDMGERKTACVYQIWDKRGGKKVRYVSSAYPEDFLKVEDDPLGITGFFNQPRPLEFIAKTDDIVPTAPYSLYETQADELNSLTTRINRITKAIKARGLYDSNLGSDIEAVMTADDNQLLPADKQASLAAEKGLSNAIWFMPLDILITTLRELLAAREVCKQTIYEIMGVADILRGSSNAAETLGAQQIKTQWGSLRLRPKQKEVQRYVRDLLRMMLEVAATKFSQETWARMTGLPYLTDAQFDQASAIAQAAALQGQQQPAQQLKQAVKWADVLSVLKDDVQRAYRIDIETNSTVEPEAMEDQKNITELMTAISGYLQGIGPLVIQGVMPWQVAQTMLLAISRRFRFGAVIEDQIKAMQPPKPPEAEDKSGEMAKKDADAAAQTAQLQSQIAQLQVKNQQLQSSKDLDKRAADVAMGELQLDTQRQIFAMEQKAANDALRSASERESNKLDLKRHVAGYEVKAAKADTGAASRITGKVDAGVAALTQQVEAMHARSDQHSDQLAALMKAISAPRKRTAVRDAQGRLVGATDELVE